MALLQLLAPLSPLSCVFAVLQVKPTAWAGQSMGGWASAPGHRRRAPPQLSPSSPVSPRWRVEHLLVMLSAEMVSAGLWDLCLPPYLPHPSMQPCPPSPHTARCLGAGSPGGGQWLLRCVCGSVVTELSGGVGQEGVVGLTVSSVAPLMPELCACVQCLQEGRFGVGCGFNFLPKRDKSTLAL